MPITRAQAMSEAVKREAAKAERILREGVTAAGSQIVTMMGPISLQAAIAAKDLVARGIPPGEAVRAAAKVAEWKFLRQSVPPLERSAADLSTAPTELFRRALAREF